MLMTLLTVCVCHFIVMETLSFSTYWFSYVCCASKRHTPLETKYSIQVQKLMLNEIVGHTGSPTSNLPLRAYYIN